MKKPFKDPIAIKEKKDGTWPWSFKAPTKDQATSGSIIAGDNYGVGHRSPVGLEKPRPMSSGVIPQESNCYDPNDIIGKPTIKNYGKED